ncbi:MAG TPA: DegT/DnrJ/EryC1/StrS family aminotransferase [Candidatus Acidoferrales bacterium]|nr:DegT/DnrJ/EryC1/StrS family aminotransferase [Candidatus Acidoferrales bacterium]
MEVPFLDLRSQYLALREELVVALERVSQKAQFILGEEVEAFEREFAAFSGARFAVALNSGTSALHLALIAAGVKPGDEVITSSNSFIATVEAIAYAGARPVFADIDPRTANLDPASTARALSRSTGAILPVHLYGRPAAMEEFRRLARQHDVALVEDACQAHGACCHGRPVGTFGVAGAFSFYPTKNLNACGEGGALVTDDPGVAELARSLRNHGQSGRYVHDRIGFNYRMEAWQAAVLRVKLRRLGEWTEGRRRIAELYRRRLAGARLELPEDDPGSRPVYHIFAVYVDHRDAVQEKMAAKGVATAVHYPLPLHLQKACAAWAPAPGSLPATERACARVLCLPIFPELTAEQAEYVADCLVDIVGEQ